MSVKIRLRRMGKKKQPHYRIVVADSRSPRDGRFVENLGYYNPIPDPARVVVDLDRIDYWLGEGAIMSATVGNLVTKARAGGDDRVALGDLGGESVASGNGEAAANGQAAEAEAEVAVAAEAEAGADADADEASGADAAPEADAATEASVDGETEAAAASEPAETETE